MRGISFGPSPGEFSGLALLWTFWPGPNSLFMGCEHHQLLPVLCTPHSGDPSFSLHPVFTVYIFFFSQSSPLTSINQFSSLYSQSCFQPSLHFLFCYLHHITSYYKILIQVLSFDLALVLHKPVHHITIYCKFLIPVFSFDVARVLLLLLYLFDGHL